MSRWVKTLTVPHVVEKGGDVLCLNLDISEPRQGPPVHAIAAEDPLGRAPFSQALTGPSTMCTSTESVYSILVHRSLLQAYCWAWEHTNCFGACYLLQEYMKLLLLHTITSLDVQPLFLWSQVTQKFKEAEVCSSKWHPSPDIYYSQTDHCPLVMAERVLVQWEPSDFSQLVLKAISPFPRFWTQMYFVSLGNTVQRDFCKVCCASVPPQNQWETLPEVHSITAGQKGCPSGAC